MRLSTARLSGQGFQPQDLVALASGYWAKQHNEEVEKDLAMIKSEMNLLGTPDGRGDDDEL